MQLRVASLLLVASALGAQQPTMEPTNSAPNPYKTIEGWAKLPEGRTWGSTSAVDIDKDGTSIWVAERCGANSCATSQLPAILKFDSSGTLVKAFGSGLLFSPHGIHVDRDGNVWVTDCACTLGRNAPRDTTRGHQVFKFSPDGKLLLTLGKAGGAREPGYFWQPNDIVTDKDGTIYVAEGHADSSANEPMPAARILVFDKKGKFKRAWGTYGPGNGQLKQPHALAFDSKGRLFVGDRSNNRIVILDKKFNILDTWYQFSRPSGIYIDANDKIYVADSESGSVNPAHGAWTRGIRVGEARTGQITAFIPDPATNPPSTSAAEGVAVDKKGNIYGAEVGPRALKRYVRQP